MTMTTESIVDLLLEAPDLKTLKKHKKPLTPEERAAFDGAGDDRSATAIKSEVDGKTWYAVYTHRAYQVRPTLKGAVAVYPAIASTG